MAEKLKKIIFLAPVFLVAGIFDYRFHQFYWRPLNIFRPIHQPPQFDFFSIWHGFLLIALLLLISIILKNSLFAAKLRRFSLPILLIVTGIVSAAWMYQPSLPVLHSFFWFVSENYILPILFFTILLYSIRDSATQEKFLKILTGSLCALGILAIIEYATNALPGINKDFLGRLVWPYIDPFVSMKPESANWLAYLFGPLAVFSAVQIIQKKSRWYIGTLGISIIILLLTKSYTGIGVTFLLLAYLIFLHLPRRYKKIFCAAALVLVLIFIFTQKNTRKFQILLGNYTKENSIERRAQIYRFTWQAFREHPFAGIGPGNYQSYFRENAPRLRITIPEEEIPPHPHNLTAQFWSDLGLPGLAAMLIIYLAAARALLLHPRANLTVFPLAYFLGHGLVDSAYGLSEISVLFWIFLWYFVTNEKRQGI